MTALNEVIRASSRWGRSPRADRPSTPGSAGSPGEDPRPFVTGPGGQDADEDAGLMVLRFGSADLDRTAPITCETRTGDDW